ncbi:MAG: phosphotransferase family protein [Acidimicrobiales bacterium]|jgi:aminoglycoside phosphotransferase (APT) family kinase protein|nr:phosphotransferase family protein [Acidimicrobiales bacterium]
MIGGEQISESDLHEHLVPWLSAKLGYPIELEEVVVPQGAGHSNETVLLTARWQEELGFRREELVLRLQAREPAVFPVYDLPLQCDCMRLVAEHSDVPVPRVHWVEVDTAVLGRPFFVMERVEGLVPPDRLPYTMDGWLLASSPEDQRRLWLSGLRAMAGVHRLDPDATGFGILDRPEHGPTGLAQQYAWWEDYARWTARGREHPTLDPATAWLREHLPTPTGPVGITWGDARIGNIMFRDFEAVAVLDWEMASLGPAEVDAAWYVLFPRFFSDVMGVPDLPGFPSAAESYEFYAEQLGRPLDDLTWYEVFAAWRHANVMARMADIYVELGSFSPEDGEAARRNNMGTRLLAQLLDLPDTGPVGLMG